MEKKQQMQTRRTQNEKAANVNKENTERNRALSTGKEKFRALGNEEN